MTRGTRASHSSATRFGAKISSAGVDRRFSIWLGRLFAVCALLAAHGAAAQNSEINAQQGGRLVRALCAQCHSVEKFGDSPLAIAPPFRTLHERYSVDVLAQKFTLGIVTAHPTMPQFMFDAGQLADMVAYLKSLE